MANMKSSSNVMKFTYYGDPEVMSEVQKQADALGLSRNAYMNLIIGAYCGSPEVLKMASSLLKSWDKSPFREKVDS